MQLTFEPTSHKCFLAISCHLETLAFIEAESTEVFYIHLKTFLLLFRVWSFPAFLESDWIFFEPILIDQTLDFTAEWIGCSSAIVVGSEDDTS